MVDIAKEIIVYHRVIHVFIFKTFYFVIAEEALAAAILIVMEDSALSIGVGQAYDGEANMAGANTGTATQIQKKNLRAIYSNCWSYVLLSKTARM